MNMNTAYNQGYIDGMTKVAWTEYDDKLGQLNDKIKARSGIYDQQLVEELYEYNRDAIDDYRDIAYNKYPFPEASKAEKFVTNASMAIGGLGLVGGALSAVASPFVYPFSPSTAGKMFKYGLGAMYGGPTLGIGGVGIADNLFGRPDPYKKERAAALKPIDADIDAQVIARAQDIYANPRFNKRLMAGRKDVTDPWKAKQWDLRYDSLADSGLLELDIKRNVTL